MPFGYKQKTNWYDSYFAKGIEIPDSASATCTTPLSVGKTGNALTARITAATDVSIPAGKKVTFTPIYCADDAGSFAAPNPAYAITLTNSGATALTYAAGDELCSIVLPDSEMEYANITITTDGTCTGTLDVAQGYTPR